MKDLHILLKRMLQYLTQLVLPFVYIYERSDFSVKLYGAIIYPEHIREVLQLEKFGKFFTGKFTMLTKFDKNSNEYLEINIELKSSVAPTYFSKIVVVDALVKNHITRNSEYFNNYRSIPKKVTPALVFWAYGDPSYFKSGIKQKWVKK